MMVATYTCNGIVFPADENDYLNDGFGSFNSFNQTLFSFSDWLDFAFHSSYQEIFKNIQHDTAEYRSSIRTRQYIKENYYESINFWKPDIKEFGVFEEVGYIWKNPTGGYDTNPRGAGLRWYNTPWAQGQGAIEWLFGETRAGKIEEEYSIYVQVLNGEHSGSLIDTITLFLGNLWQGFTQLMKLLTFTNIPNCPMWIVGILNIFFIPMWIVLIIGIAPYVSDLIKAIASFIESFTPW